MKILPEGVTFLGKKISKRKGISFDKLRINSPRNEAYMDLRRIACPVHHKMSAVQLSMSLIYKAVNK
jgi:hypothetical protein